MYKRYQLLIEEDDIARMVSGRRTRGSIGFTNEKGVFAFRADRQGTPRRAPIAKVLNTKHGKTTVFDNEDMKITISIRKEEGHSPAEVIRAEVEEIAKFLGETAKKMTAVEVDPFGY